MKVDSRKTENVQSIASQSDAMALRRFLELAKYYRRFIKEFPDISSFLRAKISSKKKF